jgi:hypothetical protein
VEKSKFFTVFSRDSATKLNRRRFYSFFIEQIVIIFFRGSLDAQCSPLHFGILLFIVQLEHLPHILLPVTLLAAVPQVAKEVVGPLGEEVKVLADRALDGLAALLDAKSESVQFGKENLSTNLSTSQN